ncbi:MAG: hypothetical protein JNN20_18490 [Betaproteobacteria bacterium]|nr:hypothetical protein [Betaproteobacteria bacterium]
MKLEIQLLMDRQRAGEALGGEEIRTLMLYAIELLKEFNQHTLDSIEFAHNMLADEYRMAA